MQPLTGLWGAVGNNPRATDMEALRAWAGCGDGIGYQHQPPCRRYPHRTDGQLRTGGGDGGRRLLTYPR